MPPTASPHGGRTLAWLLFIAALVLGSGYGLHEPWAPDSPRFALVARDMLASGDWLFPRVGGDLYADKPPFFFWLLGGSIWLTGSVRAGFLLPSLLAGLGTLWLTFDLARRLWDSRSAMLTGLLLLASIQFTLQAHTAQIDGVLCFFTTLGLYGLLRHLLLGPDWRWYVLGGAACGIGIITKGVGFLPLLVLLPWYVMKRRGTIAGPRGSLAAFGAAPLAALAVVAAWFVPMLLAASGDAALAAYRDEILFGQTVDRYLDAAGHLKPAWYFLTNVIPWAWLPLVLLLPWLVPKWRAAVKQGDARVVLPLAWALLVLLFFTLSSGKRGVYILPALPAVCLAATPWIRELASRPAIGRLAAGVLALFAAGTAFGVYHLGTVAPAKLDIADPAILPLLQWAAALMALTALGWLLAARRYGGFAALAGYLMTLWLVVGWFVMPVIDDERSGARIVRAAEASMPPAGELGITRPKESLLLQARGPFTNFGHRRADRDQELADAARWLAAGDDRRLIVPADVMSPCFKAQGAIELGVAHRRDWRLVSPGEVNAECAARGHDAAAIAYVAPAAPSAKRTK
ncbi:MAG TPA: glycosyltransferase family 39 protein [Woeseiaceae bacterium]|nr:glycosyltransferase family 39 protein [Woeseiaceae bacterium]